MKTFQKKIQKAVGRKKNLDFPRVSKNVWIFNPLNRKTSNSV